jgi:hypothetical protein
VILLVEGSTKLESNGGGKLFVGDFVAENIWIGFWNEERAFNVISIGRSNFLAEGEAELEFAYGMVFSDLGLCEQEAVVFGVRGLRYVRGMFIWFAWDCVIP